MKAWQPLQIKDLGRVVTGKTPPTESAEYFDGDELFVSPKDLSRNSYYVESTVTRISEKALEKFKGQVIPRDAVMFTSLSFAFGKMGIASKSCITNQQINSVVVYHKHSARFVYYLLRAYEPYIFAYNSGIDTPIVPKSVFEKIPVVVPAKVTQQKIAALLSACDDLITNNQRRIALLESMAEEIYREWFLRMRFPGHENVKTEKGIPAGWSPSNLGSIATFVMGQSPSSEYYNEIGDGLPFHQGVGTYGERYPVHKVFCSSEGRQAKSGDILFSVRAPVGRLNIADVDLIIGRGLAAMRHRQGFNSFLFYLLKVTFATEDMIGNGSIFNSVGKDELARHPILNPPSPLIQKFQNIVVPIDSQLATLYASTARLISMRDALLLRLISSKLRVDQLDIQYPPSMTAELEQAAQG